MLYILCTLIIYFFFFFNDTATTEIYTLSLHDALPISHHVGADHQPLDDLHRFGTSEVEGDATLVAVHRQEGRRHLPLRSEEHTSELQSQSNLVCRLLLEKKKKTRQNWMPCPKTPFSAS